MYSELIPTDLQDELIRIRDSVTEQNFRIGDIVWQVVSEHPEAGLMQIYKAVGMFVGKQERTVREYAAVSAFYDIRAREEFDVLAYDHFRVALRLGEHWRGALEWCVQAGDAYNRPATVEAMLAQYGNKQVNDNIKDALPEDPEGESETEQMLYLIQRLRTTLYMAADVMKSAPEDLIKRLEGTLQEFEEYLKKAEAVL